MLSTAAGLGGAGTVLTGPVLLGLLASRRCPGGGRGGAARPAAGSSGSSDGPPSDPARWALLRLVDDLAYAAGVWRGCLTGRTLAPLRPRTSRPS